MMNDKPLVSVVIPFFNRADKTIRALKSVMNQTYSNFEILLVNDGSNKNISSVINFCKFNKKITIFHQKNLGVSSARNLGIEMSNGNYIAFLDSDDEWKERKLEFQIKFMTRNNIFLSYTSYSVLKHNDNKIIYISSGRKNYRFPYLVFHNRIATPTVIVDRNFLGKFRFPEFINYGEDQVLWIKLAKLTNFGNLNLDLALVHHDMHTTSLDYNKKHQAFLSINKSLANHPLIKTTHTLYIYLRNIIKK